MKKLLQNPFSIALSSHSPNDIDQFSREIEMDDAKNSESSSPRESNEYQYDIFTPPIITYQQQQSVELNFKQMLFKIVNSIITAVPLYIIPVGYYVGLTSTSLPHIIIRIIETIAQGNTLLSYNLLGMFFEWKNSLRSTVIILRTLLVKVVTGLVIGLVFYYSLTTIVNEKTRFFLLLCCVCPCPLLNTMYSVEYNVARIDITAGIVSYSCISSFIQVVILYCIYAPSV
ncbi:AEC family transporter [Entamoeba marina]